MTTMTIVVKEQQRNMDRRRYLYGYWVKEQQKLGQKTFVWLLGKGTAETWTEDICMVAG